MSREAARRLARAASQRGEPLGWFEDLYAAALAGGLSLVPWADCKPNPHLVGWLDREGTGGRGLRALVVGCGLGDDAEELSRRGFAVTAFDLSESAVALARRRFPATEVRYAVADLLRPPEEWRGGFGFVLEAYTLQVLPLAMRPEAIRSVASFVAPGGELLVIARARDDGEDAGELPWPLSRADLAGAEAAGLAPERIEDYLDDEEPPVRRFRASFRSIEDRSRPGGA